MKSIKSLTATETLEIISKQYADTKDIKKLACCGDITARKIKQQIQNELSDWLLPPGKIPMDILVQKLNININYLKRLERR